MEEKTKGIVVVDRIRPGEVEAAAKILADSFLTENLFKFMFEGVSPERQVRATLPWFRTWISVFADQGEIHTARLEGNWPALLFACPLMAIRQRVCAKLSSCSE